MSHPTCPYQPACPGCPHFGATGLSEMARGKLRAVGRLWGIDEPEEVECPGRGARYRVRLSVRGRAGDVRIGIFEVGSHRLVHIPGCTVHHPSIQSLLPRLKKMFDDAEVSPYDEARHAGLLRAIQLAVEPSTGRVQVVLLLRDDLKREIPVALSDVGVAICREPLVQGVFLGALPHKTNALQAERFVHIGGEFVITDQSGGTDVFYPPGAFGQANPILHGHAVEEIHEAVSPSAPVVEYYAGVGTIGLGLARRGHRVLVNELGEGSLEGLRMGRAHQGLSEDELPILVGKAGAFAERYGASDVVIVDPPRKGLDAPLLERLRQQAPRRLIYLSCGIDALFAESEQLLESDLYEARSLRGYTYFPHTDHVESLLILDRKR